MCNAGIKTLIWLIAAVIAFLVVIIRCSTLTWIPKVCTSSTVILIICRISNIIVKAKSLTLIVNTAI